MSSLGMPAGTGTDSGSEFLGGQTGPCAMVIFGATGDLTARKLIPSLYNLARSNHLSREFAIVGVARTDMPVEKFRETLTQKMQSFIGSTLDRNLWE